ncbi:MAG TPA: hypothetical protein VGH28_31045 [Polyangiaceae bacterium]|jgi:hypothetical protein
MLRHVLIWLLCLAALLAVGQAHASYTEAHVTGEDARAVIARDGSVVVTHAISYRVVAGALRTIAIVGFEDDLRFRPTASVTSSDGQALGASVVRDDHDVVHVTVDDPKGLKRGDWRFELVYETSLVGRVTREGALLRLRFALPPSREGVDGARLVLDLPSAPTEPRQITDGDGAADLSTLRRMAERDELELVRPHVPKGEAATFYARVDPKALPEMKDPAVREPAPIAPMLVAQEGLPIGRAVLVAACALALFALALAKGRLLATARGLVPISAAARAGLAALFYAAGVYAEAAGRLTLGAALVALAMPLLAWRIASEPRGVRGPATWLVVKPEEALARARSRADWLDGTTRTGALVLTCAIAVVLVLCRVLRAAGGGAPYLVAIDALAIVPIFFTGTSRQRPPSAAREGEALGPIAAKLASIESVKVAPLARVLPDGALDETRLLASPRLAMAGALGIEIGVAWQTAGGATLPSFEVLARVTDATFAAAKMTAAYPAMRALPGRKPEERVYRFEPEGPSAASCAACVRDLAEILRDRRLALGSRSPGEERRLPPNARLPAAPSRASLA